MKVLSIRQPWAWLIINGYKDIENRTWSTSFRGRFLIHASKTYDGASQAFDWILTHFPHLRGVIPACKHSYNRGGIVGKATLTDCVTEHNSPWFAGPYGFVIADARHVEFIRLPGRLGFFEYKTKFAIGEVITFKPSPNSGYVTGPIADIHIDERGRVQYHVRIEHSSRYASCYWVWESEARAGGIQLALFDTKPMDLLS